MNLTPRACSAGVLTLVGFLPVAAAAPVLTSKSTSISIDVRSATTGQPVAGARVELFRVDASAGSAAGATDASGRVDLAGVAPGRYRAVVRAEGFAEARADSLVLGADG